MKKIISLLLLLAVVISLAACAEEVKYGHCEIELPLPKSFEEHDSGGVYDVSYSDGRMIVGLLRLSYSACVAEGISTAMSPSRFGEYYRKKALTGIETSEMLNHGDVPYYTYEIEGGGMKYKYVATFYFTPYAYIAITYIFPAVAYDELIGEVLSYAEGVKIVPYSEKSK